jgi:hypothetical protein
VTHTLPDAELLVCDWLRVGLPGVGVGTTLVGWRAGQSHVQVRRTGGAVKYGWVDTSDLQLEIRAQSREAAADLATQVRALLGAMAREHHPAGAVISRCTETRGPGWLPDPDGMGRYRTEWQLVAHPERSP